jgi:hypothetical protein
MIAEHRPRPSGVGLVNLPFRPADSERKRMKDEGKRMSRHGNRISKLIAALGVFGLVMALAVPRVGAQVTTFSAANYTGPYGCTISNNDDFDTAVIQYSPDGSGGYTTGTLVASSSAFGIGFDAATPAGNYCTWFLEPSESAYSIDSTGLGFETLTWTPSIANNAACPGAFTDEDAIALRNLTNPTASIRAEVADGNLFNFGVTDDFAGHGTCLN